MTFVLLCICFKLRQKALNGQVSRIEYDLLVGITKLLVRVVSHVIATSRECMTSKRRRNNIKNEHFIKNVIYQGDAIETSTLAKET